MVGIRSAVLAYTMWGGFTAYWKLLSDFAPADLVGWRVASATGVLVVLLVARGTWGNVVRALSDAATRRRLALASALLAVNWSTYVFAVVSDRVLETALGYFLAPLITMAIGVVVLGERLTTTVNVRPGQTLVLGTASRAGEDVTLLLTVRAEEL